MLASFRVRNPSGASGSCTCCAMCNMHMLCNVQHAHDAQLPGAPICPLLLTKAGSLRPTPGDFRGHLKYDYWHRLRRAWMRWRTVDSVASRCSARREGVPWRVNIIRPHGGVESQSGSPRDRLETPMATESITELITREGRVVRHCLGLIDTGLRRCNACLESLQPKQPGRITLYETKVKPRGKLTLNDTRWRLVRWRIRRENSDGTVVWTNEKLPLRGAAKRTLSKFQFHDTEPQVREVIRAAVGLIEWRGRVLRTATNFVTGVEAHNKFGIPSAIKHINKAAGAAESGRRRRESIRAAAQQLAAVRAAKGK